MTASPFRETWFVDFEYYGSPGDIPRVCCMAAKELNSGREIKLWRDALLALERAPFDTGPESLMVAYFASAEVGCFKALGWPLPENIEQCRFRRVIGYQCR